MSGEILLDCSLQYMPRRTLRDVLKIFFFFFFFGTTTAAGQGLPVPTSEVGLSFSDFLLPLKDSQSYDGSTVYLGLEPMTGMLLSRSS